MNHFLARGVVQAAVEFTAAVRRLSPSVSCVNAFLFSDCFDQSYHQAYREEIDQCRRNAFNNFPTLIQKRIGRTLVSGKLEEL